MNKDLFDSHSSKRVSYIIATKNRAQFLEKALIKAKNILSEEDELIVIDGGSDNSKKIIKKFSNIVDIFISEPDLSPAHAVNKGMLLARGKYIKEFPDDDEIYKTAMEQAVNVMEKNLDVDLLVCGGTKQRGGKIFPVYLEPGINYGKNVEDVFKYGACGVGFLVRRKSLAAGGLYPTSIISDNMFVLEFISKGLNVKFCRINLFNHPIYKHSTIVKKSTQVEKESVFLLKRYTPVTFYLKQRFSMYFNQKLWRLSQMFRSNIFLFYVSYPLRFVFKKVFIENKKKANIQREKALIWDGGFS